MIVVSSLLHHLDIGNIIKFFGSDFEILKALAKSKELVLTNFKMGTSDRLLEVFVLRSEHHFEKGSETTIIHDSLVRVRLSLQLVQRPHNVG